MMTASELKDAVLARYRSVYAFCRAHPEMKRATVYLVLSGRYPGNGMSRRQGFRRHFPRTEKAHGAET